MSQNDANARTVQSKVGEHSETSFVEMARCWCGNTRLEPFSPEYRRCAACETLCLAKMPSGSDLAVKSDSEAYYGRRYFARVSETYDQPSLEERSRADLPERCTYWLRALLRYKAPPAKVLELGCAHGGFVALMRSAGFDATGLDLSPALVKAAEKRFGLKLLTGPVEDQSIPAESLDAVVLMDVLEHFPDPSATMGHCARLLKPDGILMLQTPRYEEGGSFEEMQREGDRFLEQLKPDQHLYLFSQTALRRFFADIGMPHVRFEPAIFSHYDQFAVAMKQLLRPRQIVLRRNPEQRLAQALIDGRTELESMSSRLQQAERDSAARLAQVLELERHLAASEEDRAARLAAVDELHAQLQESEADRKERGKQIESLGRRLAETDADRTARLAIIEELHAGLLARESESLARAKAIEDLGLRLAETDDDRNARLTAIEALNPRLLESERDRAARGRLIDELGEKLAASEGDRIARLASIEQLQTWLEESERDRAARGRLIGELGEKLAASEADRAARLQAAEQLQTWLEESEHDRAARGRLIGELGEKLVATEADRAARLAAMGKLEGLAQQEQAESARLRGELQLAQARVEESHAALQQAEAGNATLAEELAQTRSGLTSAEQLLQNQTQTAQDTKLRLCATAAQLEELRAAVRAYRGSRAGRMLLALGWHLPPAEGPAGCVDDCE